MRVSFDWLKEFIDIGTLSAEELADKLDLTGTAVESVESPGKGLEKVVVGQIKEVKPHPNADNLCLAKVDVAKTILNIVCGARNFRQGDKVPVALAGAVMPSGLKIKKAVIRGEESNGMLASETELNLGDDHSGIMILDPDLKTGEKLTKALALDDFILDLEITPNRPDCMSVVGIAREAGAVLNRPYRKPEIVIRGDRREASEVIKVELKDPDLCPRYTAKMVAGVKTGPSPKWMQQRLIASGARPINNLVDITNYVLFELGQPLHAFDYDLIAGGEITVRRAKKDEKMVTLDEIERKLLPDNLVIADKSGPVALAGIMGGMGSEVGPNTKNILLESAYFDPKSISRSSREIGLISESSIRFERGIDPENVIFASERACHLYQELAGAKIYQGVIDVYPKKINPVNIELRAERVNRVLGTSLKSKKIKSILEPLELEIEVSSKSTATLEGPIEENFAGVFNVEVPTFRPDLEREIDLIEEVARLHGLNNIESTLPQSRAKTGKLSASQKNERNVKNLLVSSGYMETVNYGFTDPKILEDLKQETQSVGILNPIVEDQKVLRTGLMPGLAKNAAHNLRYGNKNLKLFEIGSVFKPVKGDVPEETKRLCLLGSGVLDEKDWLGERPEAGFYYLKGTLEAICKRLQIDNLVFQSEDTPYFEAGKSAAVYFGEERAGYLGTLSADIAEKLHITQQVNFLEIDYEPLEKYSSSMPDYIPISKYPGITLDVAILVDEAVSHAEIKRVIAESGEELLKSVSLFDLYTGKGIPAGKKSMAYSMHYQAFNRTLTTEEAVALHWKVKEALKREVGAEIR